MTWFRHLHPVGVDQATDQRPEMLLGELALPVGELDPAGVLAPGAVLGEGALDRGVNDLESV